jgi:spermidine/putrescine transport system substrate-binding protein
MSKRMMLLHLALTLSLSATSLAQDGENELATPAGLSPWVCPEGFEGETLRVYNWSTYIAEDTISSFKERCKLNDVIYDTYASNEEMIEVISRANSGYDIVVPTDDDVATMIEAGLLRKLNKDNIPNLANVSPDLLDAPHDPENDYSVPYQWGTMGIGYNLEKTGKEITSWQQMFDYAGNVAWIENPRPMLSVALVMLGYDPNGENLDEIEAARRFLLENSDNVVAIAEDDGQTLLELGEVDIAIEYNGDMFQLMYDCECDSYRYVIPKEGTIIWIDNLVIPARARNPELAEVFIDYILDPQVGADISNYTAYGTPNQLALDEGLIDEALIINPGIYPTRAVRERLFFIETVNEEARLAFDEAWNEVKILIGG